MSLSNQRIADKDVFDAGSFIYTEVDVKNFIRMLKEELNKTPLIYKRDEDEFDKIVNELAGDALVGKSD